MVNSVCLFCLICLYFGLVAGGDFLPKIECVFSYFEINIHDDKIDAMHVIGF